jgi:hypothetical protein
MLLPQQNATIPYGKCSRARPCNRFRDCPTCAASRQRRIADLSDHLAQLDLGLAWTILSPATQSKEAISKARSAWLEQTRPTAAIWTVEAGTLRRQLHLNIIHTPIPHYLPRYTRTWSQPLQNDHRQIAAYISKPSGFPTAAEYTGRLFGACGPLWQFLTAATQAPIIAAATLEHNLASIASARLRPLSPTAQPTTTPTTPQDFAKIAKRHLPEIYAALEALKKS